MRAAADAFLILYQGYLTFKAKPSSYSHSTNILNIDFFQYEAHPVWWNQIKKTFPFDKHFPLIFTKYCSQYIDWNEGESRGQGIRSTLVQYRRGEKNFNHLLISFRGKRFK